MRENNLIIDSLDYNEVLSYVYTLFMTWKYLARSSVGKRLVAILLVALRYFLNFKLKHSLHGTRKPHLKTAEFSATKQFV